MNNNNNFIPKNNNNYYNNQNYNMNRPVVSNSYGTGFLCGLFLNIEIFTGVLYSSEERHRFIIGWKIGVFIVLIITAIIGSFLLLQVWEF